MVAQILIYIYASYCICIVSLSQNIAARIPTTLTCIGSTEIAIVQQCHFFGGLLHIENQDESHRKDNENVNQ